MHIYSVLYDIITGHVYSDSVDSVLVKVNAKRCLFTMLLCFPLMYSNADG